MDNIDRKSLQILANSTRENQGESDLTRNLDAAAESGDREQYDRARNSFDSLPPEARRNIGDGAVEKAETVRIETKLSKATGARPVPADAEKEQDMLGLDWVLGKPEATAVAARKKKTKMRDPKAARPTAQAPLPDDGEGNWNWQALPDDPTLRRNKSMDPLQELREQMLGPQSGQTWRRSNPSGE